MNAPAIGRLLVVDDDPLILQCMRLSLPAPDYEVVTAQSVTDGLAQFRRHQPDAVLLDVELPDHSGLVALRELCGLDRRVPVIVMTGHGSAEIAITAMSGGAFEYVTKPFEPDDILPIIDSAIETSQMARNPAILPDEQRGDVESAAAEVILGKSPAMVEVFRSIGRVASRDVTVLILGETGTGKELVARAIYQHSRRCDQIFHAINCAAIPEQLLESELFGHEKGAFTGADQRRIGKFEVCDGGTLFLDEIGDMSAVMQTKLLRVLQQKEFERVGSNKPLKSDVRIIAATNRDLETAMKERTFRSDLYYRLNEFTIQLPPLRDRGEDLPLMVTHFCRSLARNLNKDFASVAPETMKILCDYDWPGNVRQLQGVIKQTLLRSGGPVITPAYLPTGLIGPTQSSGEDGTSGSWEAGLAKHVNALLLDGNNGIAARIQESVDRIVFAETLAATGNNISEASNRLGISRPTLRNRIKHLGLRVDH